MRIQKSPVPFGGQFLSPDHLPLVGLLLFCEVENRCRSCRKRGKIVVLDLADQKNEKFQTAPARAVAAAAEAAASGAAAAS